MHTMASGGPLISGVIGFAIVIIGSAIAAFYIWLAIIAIQFLRWGRKAFERYVTLTEHAPQLRTVPPAPTREQS